MLMVSDTLAFFLSGNTSYEGWPLPPTWDAGRSGTTLLARHINTGQIVVIKLTDNRSPQFETRRGELRNEARALEMLQGKGVPRLMEYGEFIQEDLNYEAYYLTIEYVQAARVEEHIASLDRLSVEERKRILVAFFSLLHAAHRRGIANNDVDIKHFFWDKEKQRLILIDWGNAKLFDGSVPEDEAQFDLERSAEIIWALATGQPPEQVGNGEALQENRFSSFPPLPPAAEKLCDWVIKTHPAEREPPPSAEELALAFRRRR